jgi:hypothetical protein
MEAIRSAESLNIKVFHYDKDVKDIILNTKPVVHIKGLRLDRHLPQMIVFFHSDFIQR